MADGGTGSDDDRIDLLDVRSIPLDKLFLSEDTVLKNAVDRVVNDVGPTISVLAAFDSALPAPDEESTGRPADERTASGDTP